MIMIRHAWLMPLVVVGSLQSSDNVLVLASSTTATRLGSPRDAHRHDSVVEDFDEQQQQRQHRQLQKRTDVVGNNGKPSDKFPLGRCEGDCDSDTDCSRGLKCQQRDGDEQVPGCQIGSRHDGQDFCYDPDDNGDGGGDGDGDDGDDRPPAEGTLNRIGNNGNPSSYFPLGRCHGDCDSDKDCKGSLKCYQRGSRDGKPPGCPGRTEGDTDYCYDPDDDDDGDGDRDDLPPEGTLAEVGNNGDPNYAFPLGKCHADCDSDRDCKGSLKCFQRRSGDDEPPGCRGRVEGDSDYCYDPDDDDDDDDDDEDDGGGGGGDRFRLKMYWREGYTWQESRREKKWCMRCEKRKGNDCKSGDDIELDDCGGDNVKFVLRNRSGRKAQLQIAGKDLCLELGGEKTFFGVRRRIIEARTCSSSNDDQYFEASWDSSRFDIEANDGKCVSQHHHPKSGEDLLSEKCSRAENDETRYWVKY